MVSSWSFLGALSLDLEILNTSTCLFTSSSISSSFLALSLNSQGSSFTVSLFRLLAMYSALLLRRLSREKLIRSASPICLERQSLNLEVMENFILGGEGREGCEFIQCFVMWDLAENALPSLTCSTARSKSERDDSPT